MLQKPEGVKPGDRIGIFLSSSPVKEPFRSQGLNALKQLGFEPMEADDILSRNGFFAKNTMESLRDIQGFMSDPDIRALWAGRGGYGANRFLHELEKMAPPLTPKIVIGSSDVSYLLWFILDHWQTPVFYGPMVYSAVAEGRFVKSHVLRLLGGRYKELRFKGRILAQGHTKGPVTGGCLSNLVSLIGTRFMPKTEGRILLLEDINEKAYRLDRMLWQLSEAGIFRHIRGLVLGEFPGCFASRRERIVFQDRLRLFLEGRCIPVVDNLPFGHAQRCSMLPLGVEVEIDTRAFAGLILKEKGVRE